jgi:hypothetical protein
MKKSVRNTIHTFKIDDINRMWDKGVLIGNQGVNGLVKRVTLKSTNLILKHFAHGHTYDANRYSRNAPYKKYVDDAKQEKEAEHATHMEAYKRLTEIGKSHFVCEPFTSSHPFISIQEDADQTGQGALTVKSLLAGANPEQQARVQKSVLSKLVTILSTFEQVGIFHADLKFDNIIAIKNGNTDYCLKVIDFGIARLTERSMPNKHAKVLREKAKAKRNNASMLSKVFREHQKSAGLKLHWVDVYPPYTQWSAQSGSKPTERNISNAKDQYNRIQKLILRGDNLNSKANEAKQRRAQPLRLVTYNRHGDARLNTMSRFHQSVQNEFRNNKNGLFSTRHVYLGAPRRGAPRAGINKKKIPFREEYMIKEYKGTNSRLKATGKKTAGHASTLIQRRYLKHAANRSRSNNRGGTTNRSRSNNRG